MIRHLPCESWEPSGTESRLFHQFDSLKRHRFLARVRALSVLTMSANDSALVAATIAHFDTLHTRVDATRYFTAAALVIILHDAILSLPEDVQLVWLGRKGVERTMFLVHRLVVALALVFAVMMTAGGNTSDPSCRGSIAVIGILNIAGTALADALVWMETWQLWDCNRIVMKYMIGIFTLTFSCSLGFTVAAFVTLLDTFNYNPTFHICAFSVVPKYLVGLWASGLLFEITVFIFTFWNVLDKPRSGHAKLTPLLVRDGCLFFVAFVALRTVNVVFTLTTGPEVFLMTTFPQWAMLTVLVHQLVINQSRERSRLRANSASGIRQLRDLGEPDFSKHVIVSQEVELDADIELDSLPGPLATSPYFRMCHAQAV